MYYTTDDTEFQEAMMDDILLKPVDLNMIKKVLCFDIKHKTFYFKQNVIFI